MNKIKYALAPLMAALFVAGQRLQTEDSNNLPFSTSSQFILPTTMSTRSTSRRFDFAFATRTTTTVVPQIAEFIPSMGTNRASIRFITAPTPNQNETTTKIPLIDDDTNNDTNNAITNDKMAFKEERSPATPTTTTQLPSTVENRRPINSTIRPSNHTIHRPLSEKLTFRPNQKIAQPLKTLNNKTTPIHQINKNPIKLITDHGNKTTKSPIHVQTELDPELTELRKRIAAGIAAQRVLRERLKQASSSRLQTTNIQKVFTPVRARINGVSRRKTANVPKQAGVKITQSDLNTKKRFEGRFHYAGHIHTGRAGSPSPVIARRFIDALGILPKSQVQVEPSSIQLEKTESTGNKRAFSAGPSAVIDDDKNPNDNLQRTTKFEKMHGQKDAPSNSLELTSTPAFCRRCYKFWRNISTTNINRSAIYQYCCTIGQHKGQLYKKLRETVTIH